MYTVTLTADNRAAFDALMRFAAEQHLTVETQPNNGKHEPAHEVDQASDDDPRYDAKKVSFEQWLTQFDQSRIHEPETRRYLETIYEAERSEFIPFEEGMKRIEAWCEKRLVESAN